MARDTNSQSKGPGLLVFWQEKVSGDRTGEVVVVE